MLQNNQTPQTLRKDHKDHTAAHSSSQPVLGTLQIQDQTIENQAKPMPFRVFVGSDQGQHQFNQNNQQYAFPHFSFLPDQDLYASFSVNRSPTLEFQDSFGSDSTVKGSKKQRLLCAVLMINATVFLYSLSTSMFKVLKMTAGVTTADFLCTRYGLMLIISAWDLKRNNFNPFYDVPSEDNQRIWLMTRVVFALSAFTCFTICVTLLPISIVMVIVMTNPFWTMILAYFIDNSTIKYFEIVAMLFCFLGILLIITQKPEVEETTPQAYVAHASNWSYVLAGVSSLLFSGMYAVSSKVVKLNPRVIMFHMAFFGTILGFCWQMYLIQQTNGQPSFMNLSLSTFGFLLIISFIDFCQIAFSIRAMQLAEPGFISIFMTLGVAYGFLADVLYFKVLMSAMQLVGAGVILGSIIGVAVIRFQMVNKIQKNQDQFILQTSFQEV